MLLTVHMVAVWWCMVDKGSCVRDVMRFMISPPSLVIIIMCT